MARGGMHHHSGWFVDDDDVRVLIEDRQRQRLGLRRRLDRRRDVDGDLLTRLHRLIRLGFPPANPHVSIFDEALDLRSGVIAEHGREETIEASAVRVWRNGDRRGGAH